MSEARRMSKRDAARAQLALAAASVLAGASSLVYGDGSDGAAVFDGVNTFAFATLAGTTYTLTRDIFLTSGSIANGIKVVTASARLFCTGTFTVAAGAVLCNPGNPGVGSVQGAALLTKTLGIGTAGGAGSTNANGVNAPAQTNATPRGTGKGGAGGTGGARTGGTATFTTLSGASVTGVGFLWPMLTGQMVAQTGVGGGAFTSTVVAGGSGGGGGGSSALGITGGGGGGGGGVMLLVVFDLLNNGTIHCDGGAGGNASGGAGDAGGGGGGGGGQILCTTRTRRGSGVMRCAGGAGGFPLGAGTAGAPGDPGNVRLAAA